MSVFLQGIHKALSVQPPLRMGASREGEAVRLPGRCARLRSRWQLWGPSFSPVVTVNAMLIFPESHVYACVQSPCRLHGEHKAPVIGRGSCTNPAIFPLPSQACASIFTCCFLQCLSHSPLMADILANKIFITN